MGDSKLDYFAYEYLKHIYGKDLNLVSKERVETTKKIFMDGFNIGKLYRRAKDNSERSK